MSEREAAPSGSQPEEGDSLENHNRRSASSSRQLLADEVKRLLPGVNYDAGLRQAFLITRDWAGAEDVMQSTYLSMFQLPDWRRRLIIRMPYYVHVVIRREARQWQKQRRCQSLEHTEEHELPATPDIAPRVIRQHDAELLLAQIPEYCHEEFLLFYRDGYLLQEIESQTGTPAETIKKRIRMALDRLREHRKALQQSQSSSSNTQTITSQVSSLEKSRHGK